MEVLTVFWPCDRAAIKECSAGLAADCTLNLRMIQASHPQATKRCSILLSSATVTSL